MRDDQGTVSFRKVRHQPHREAAGAAFDSARPGHCGPGDGFPRDAASRGLAATGGRVDQAARSAFQRFRQPFSPCKDAMALLPQFGPFPNYCLVSVCWMLIWKAGNFDWKRSSPMDDSTAASASRGGGSPRRSARRTLRWTRGAPGASRVCAPAPGARLRRRARDHRLHRRRGGAREDPHPPRQPRRFSTSRPVAARSGAAAGGPVGLIRSASNTTGGDPDGHSTVALGLTVCMSARPPQQVVISCRHRQDSHRIARPKSRCFRPAAKPAAANLVNQYLGVHQYAKGTAF